MTKNRDLTRLLSSRDNTLDRIVNETELPRYLLYPLRENKAFEYLGTVRKFNAVCYKIRLLTDHNFIINYFIDVETYFIVAVQVFDLLNIFSPATIEYSDYRLVEKAFYPHKIESYINGVWDSTLSIEKVIPNVGTANWMFKLEIIHFEIILIYSFLLHIILNFTLISSC